MTKYRTIFATNPTPRDVAEISAYEAEQLEEAKVVASEVIFEGFAGMLAHRELGKTELVSDTLLYRQNHGQIVAITEKVLKTIKIPAGKLEKCLVVVHSADKKSTPVGYRLRVNGRLVGERIRTEVSAKLFRRRQRKNGDINAAAANRFLANWVSPRFRQHAIEQGMRSRRCDTLHHDALMLQKALGGSACITVEELINDPEVLRDLVDPVEAAPRWAHDLVEGVQTFGYKTCQKVAAALGVGATGKKDELQRKIVSSLTIVSNGVFSSDTAAKVAEATKVVRHG